MDAQERGDHAVRQAEKAAKRGDLALAERWSKVAMQIADAAAQLEAQRMAKEWEDEEACREELKRRLIRFAELGQDVNAWEAEHAAWKLMADYSRRTGAPMPDPMRPHPAGSAANTESHFIHLARGAEPDDGRDPEAWKARMEALNAREKG
ncbi:MAG: hypothetical protein AB7H66_06785 [Hyphomonadaceae bacterium]